MQANIQVKQQHIDELVAQDQADADSSADTQPESVLRSAYQAYLPGLVEHFGLSHSPKPITTVKGHRISATPGVPGSPIAACCWRSLPQRQAVWHGTGPLVHQQRQL